MPLPIIEGPGKQIFKPGVKLIPSQVIDLRPGSVQHRHLKPKVFVPGEAHFRTMVDATVRVRMR